MEGRALNACLPALVHLLTVLAASPDDQWKVIASVGGNDRVTHIHIINLLGREKITCFMEGSRAYGVNVRKADATRALKILQADANMRKYFIYFSDDKRVVPDNRGMRTYAVKKSYGEARQNSRSELPIELVAVLKDPEVRKLAKRHPLVVGFHARRRSYLLPDGKMGTAYEGDVELSGRKHTSGASYHFQVWDHGKEVGWSGGSEWGP